MRALRSIRRLAKAGAGVCLVALLVTGQPSAAAARGGAPAPRAPQLTPNQKLGAQLFDQCIWYVSQGRQAIRRTSDFYISLDAELDLDTTRHRGPMRLWWRTPDKYRQELTTNGQATTKILNGDFMWIVHPTGRIDRIHGTPAGARTIRQLKEDRTRMGDLAQFITLQSLKGPGVTFEFQGEKKGSGSYAGEWLKVTRKAPRATTMHFWLAYTRAANGGYIATYPGIVRIDGDDRARVPTEDYILRDWRDSPKGQPHAFRYPSSIQAYSRLAGQAPVSFLKAAVKDIKINTGIAEAVFRRPAPKAR